MGWLRCGCAVILILLLAIGVLAGAAFWLATRPAGPAYRDGTYTVRLDNGQTRVDRITPDAARSFTEKLSPPTTVIGLAKLQLEGIDFTEEELNAALAIKLAEAPVSASGFVVERVFVELHPATTQLYVYGTFHGQPLTLSSHVTFRVVANSGRVLLSDARLGMLPLGALWPRLLNWSGNSDAIAQRLAVTLPPEVTNIQPEEGTLHVTVQLQRGFTRQLSPASRLVVR
jgi:hypothetical protein